MVCCRHIRHTALQSFCSQCACWAKCSHIVIAPEFVVTEVTSCQVVMFLLEDMGAEVPLFRSEVWDIYTVVHQQKT